MKHANHEENSYYNIFLYELSLYWKLMVTVCTHYNVLSIQTFCKN